MIRVVKSASIHALKNASPIVTQAACNGMLGIVVVAPVGSARAETNPRNAVAQACDLLTPRQRIPCARSLGVTTFALGPLLP